MKANEGEALAQAILDGYLLKFTGMSFEVEEAWWLYCEQAGRPMVSVGGNIKAGKRCVRIDTEPVWMFQLVRKGWCYGAPSLAPTERTEEKIRRLMMKHGPATWSGSYLALSGVWANSGEQVARQLLEIWQEAKIFAFQPSLWEESA